VVEIVRPSGKAADAKRVVALLGLEIERGDSIRIVARGADAKEAVEDGRQQVHLGIAESNAQWRTAAFVG
jgi:phosphotransferase system HPr-like phosphotransfer protein